MERQEIPIHFADLRQLAGSVPTYIAEKVGERTVPTLQNEIENGFGIAGLDTESLILQFSETYRVDLTAFDFTGLISPKGLDSTGCVLALPLAAYFLAGWLLKTAASLLCWPLDKHLAKRIWQWQVPAFWRPAKSQPKPLVVGDFVASAAVGQFVRREQVYFRLVR